ncbi:hypothetical protein NDU88_001126 [Pleurodeles waltl]|uniref:Gypsy retrotransposon integrase-like protein 1 n=1 Tax=Pleurodeles waltl TaxID=8319 RepID=A0AAV7LXT0_PLEWA|nr:hypothetical protein NDU88_001126 [Pleurodeles waltl]
MKGHYARVCNNDKSNIDSVTGNSNKVVLYVGQEIDQIEHNTSIVDVGPVIMPECIIRLDNRTVTVLADSGSPYTMVGDKNWQAIFGETLDFLSKPDINLISYGGAKIEVVGYKVMKIQFRDRVTVGKVYVAKRGNNLLGWRHQRDMGIKLDPNSDDQVMVVSNANDSMEIFKEFPGVFSEKLGCLASFEHKIILKKNVTPVVHKVRRVPKLMLEPLKAELNRLVEAGVIEEIESSEWLAPVMLAPKDNGKRIRMCVDLRDLNKYIWVDRQPLPNITEELSCLGGSKVFSVLDLSSAYHQIVLHPESRHLTSFVTPLGAYQFLRMPFGLASAAACFQRIMKTILKAISGTLCFQDDILVHGKTVDEHDKILRKVLSKLAGAGLTVKNEKCRFRVTSVTYLGHTISGEGIRPKLELVDSIIHAPEPKNKDDVRSFLGLAEYYSKFIPNFSSVTQPLRALLKKGCIFVWEKECVTAFSFVKKCIGKMPTLGHFDVCAKTYLYTDASIKGLGAVLIQKMGQEERAIAFASRSLKEAEQHYSVIEREALACMWAVKHFKFYLWGLPFVVRTDHKPLVQIFSPKKNEELTPRIRRWAEGLMEYNFVVEYVPGPRNIVADFLSRSSVDSSEEVEDDVMVNWVRETAINDEEWKLAVERDLDRRKLEEFIVKGWPEYRDIPFSLKGYWNVRDELSFNGGELFRGSKSVPPEGVRNKILNLAHEGHLGRSLTKSRLRAIYWWPGLDREAETIVKDCMSCARNDKSKVVAKAPLSPVVIPEKTWMKLGLDFMGPFNLLPANERYVMLMVDYTSKWVVTKCVNSVDTQTVIEFLEEEFSREGIPSHLVTDNGVQLTSQDMKRFLDSLAVKHLRTALYLPQANGLAERMNRMVKACVQEAVETRTPLANLLRDLWWAYRNTPNSVTNISPFEYMRGKLGCTKLFPAWLGNSLAQVGTNQGKFVMAPGLREEYQRNYKLRFDDKHCVSSVKWKVGDLVLVRNPCFKTKGKSSFRGPFRIREVKRNIVILDNGDAWSMSRIARWRGVGDDSNSFTLKDQRRNITETSKELSGPKVSSRLRSKPLWMKDYAT